MHTASVARYLDSLALVVFDQVGADCFLEKWPSEPVDAVLLKSTSAPSGDLMPQVWLGLQLVVRTDGDSARIGYDRAFALYDELHGLRHVDLAPATADALRLVRCLAKQDTPTDLGLDANERHRWSFGFDLYVTRPTKHSLPG